MSGGTRASAPAAGTAGHRQPAWRLRGWPLPAISLALVLLVSFLDSFLPAAGRLFSPYVKHILFMCLIYSTLSLSLNVITGYIGQVSLGHAAFFGFGAFTTAIATVRLHLPFWLAFLAAGVLSGLVGVLLGLPALRIRGNFLVVVTYGMGEVLRFIALNTDALGGTSGIPGIPAPWLVKSFTDIGTSGKEAFLVVAFLLAAATVFVLARLERSAIGLAFAAVREDEIAADAMGVNPAYYKLLAFAIAGVFAGLAGSLYASYLTFVSSDIFGSYESILIITMVVVGGTRSIAGSILGALLVVLSPELLKYLKDALHLPFDPWLVLYGLLLVFMMRFRPQGLLGSDTVFGADQRRAGR